MHQFAKLIVLLRRPFAALKKQAIAFDIAMRERYRPVLLTFVVLLIISLLMAYMLFVPPYLGLSNDGSFDNVLADCGLVRLDPDDTNAYFNYYERVYLLDSEVKGTDTTAKPLRAVLQAAKLLDYWATQDNIFDVRFLALLNLIMYIAALYPFVCALLRRARSYSTGIIIAVICILVFSDVSIATRFASFYTQSLELILVLVMLDTLLLTAKYEGHGPYPIILFIAIWLMMQVNPYCALAGFVFSLVYWRLVKLPVHITHKVLFAICALVLCILSVTAVAHLEETRTKAQKFNQMTRGVLFQSNNPETTLAQFGIEPRYSILTDTYSEQVFPVVLPESGMLDEGFFDQYNIGDVLLHYASHPSAIVNLFDIGVYQAFLTRSDYSGNYEVSAGRPARSKSLFMSLWSTLKDRTAPKTVGFLLILVIATSIIYSRNAQKRAKRTGNAQHSMLTYSLLGIMGGFAVVELITVIVHSGDSELIRESFLMGVYIDLLIVLFFSEILGKLKIVKEEV